MRKWNNRLARIIIILFLLHAFMGSLILLGFSTVSFVWLSWILFTAVIIHGSLGILSTISALKIGRKTKNWYLRKNASFWTKRISGLAIMLLLIFHITAYITLDRDKLCM